jgi:hypothetical protein
MVDCVSRTEAVSARTIVRVMWCCCHWGVLPAALLPCLSKDRESLAAQVADFDCRDLTAAAWTCGVLHELSLTMLMEVVAEEAVWRLPVSGERESTPTQERPLPCRLDPASLREAASGQSAWLRLRLTQPSPAGAMGQLSLNQSSTIAWALGQGQCQSRGFWHQLTRDFPTLVAGSFAAPSQVVVRLLWGMAAVRHRHVGALSAVLVWMDTGLRLRLLRPSQLQLALWAFAVLNFSPGALVTDLQRN